MEVYVCGIAWRHEMGQDYVKVYPSADQVPCKDTGCGVVKLSIGGSVWVVPHDLKLMIATALPAGESNRLMIQELRAEIASRQAFLERLLKEEEACKTSQSKSKPSRASSRIRTQIDST